MLVLLPLFLTTLLFQHAVDFKLIKIKYQYILFSFRQIMPAGRKRGTSFRAAAGSEPPAVKKRARSKIFNTLTCQLRNEFARLEHRYFHRFVLIQSVKC
jgi:hypothetical protein